MSLIIHATDGVSLAFLGYLVSLLKSDAHAWRLQEVQEFLKFNYFSVIKERYGEEFIKLIDIALLKEFSNVFI